MQTFWTLLKESIIVQSLVTLTLVCAVVYLAVTGQEVPELLSHLTTTVIGFWFGTKVTSAVMQARR